MPCPVVVRERLAPARPVAADEVVGGRRRDPAIRGRPGRHPVANGTVHLHRQPGARPAQPRVVGHPLAPPEAQERAEERPARSPTRCLGKDRPGERGLAAQPTINSPGVAPCRPGAIVTLHARRTSEPLRRFRHGLLLAGKAGVRSECRRPPSSVRPSPDLCNPEATPPARAFRDLSTKSPHDTSEPKSTRSGGNQDRPRVPWRATTLDF